MIELLTKTFYYFAALVIVLTGFNIFASLDREAEEFLYLSEIVTQVVSGKTSQSEQIKALTEWLATNVTKTSEYPGWERPDYPDWFDGSSVASVIRGGIGNCGYQANNIITLSKYLGVKESRRYWIGKQSGSNYEHAFAELVVDGKPAVFDPNILVFQENENKQPLSLREMIENPSIVTNDTFRKIVTEVRDKPNILKLTNSPNPPLPLGENSYDIFLTYGSVLTGMYIHLKNRPLSILALAWFLFVVLISIRNRFLNRIAPPKSG